MTSLLRRVVALFRRRRLDRDLDDELAFHLVMRREEQVGRGAPSADADHTAHRQFGNVLHIKEHARDIWLFASLENVLHDLRFALRALRRSPGFAAVAVSVLAVGIGGTVAIASVVNAVLVRPLPFKDADRVVYVQGLLFELELEAVYFDRRPPGVVPGRSDPRGHFFPAHVSGDLAQIVELLPGKGFSSPTLAACRQ